MSGILEPTNADVKGLDAKTLVMLLERLLENELSANGIPLSSGYVSLDINVRDGGEDALVEWKNGASATDRLPRRRCLFQSKSGSLTKKQFTDELFQESSRTTLKERVKANFDSDGAYVLFYSGTCVGAAKAARIKDMKAALQAFYPDKELEIQIYDCSDIARWAHRFLSATTFLLRLARKGGLDNFRDWDDLSGLEANRNKFVENDQTKDFVALIRSSVGQPKTVLRIVGRSGLGKTRVAFEAFRPPARPADDTAQAARSGSMAYVDYLDESDVVGIIAQLRIRGASGVVIVDNCPEDVHDRLAEQVRHSNSNLSLLTMDYHVDEAPEKPGVFNYKRSPNETIRQMIRDSHPTLGQTDVDIVALYADGFPKVASLLQDAPLEEDVRLEPLNDKALTDRLLRGRAEMTDDAKRIIEVCALFVHLGFDGPVKKEREYAATKILGIDPSIFYERAQFFRPRVLDKIGDYVRVSPVPLALRLAESYYDRKESDAHTTLIEDSDMPPPLKDALGRRFRDLSTSERAEEVSRRLMEPTHPFGQAEVLNTEQGSLVFRSLAEVNPPAAMMTLNREFGTWSTAQLLEIGPGRRNLVWTLEVLGFNRDLFVQAAHLMAKLAIAENEKLGNNATAQFLHFFQLFLAGTEAGPDLRLQVIDELLSSGDEHLTLLGIRALGRAVANNGTSRMLGPEHQGGRVLKDWSPKTYGEIFGYLDSCTSRLTNFAVQDSESGAEARRLLAHGVRHLLGYQRFDAVEQALRQVTGSYQHAWPEAVESIQDALHFDLKEAAPENRARANSWLELLHPKDKLEQVKLIVTNAPFNLVQSEDGAFVDVGALAAHNFASQYAVSLENWKEVLPPISSGEQRQGLSFGEAVGELVRDDYQEEFVQAAVAALIDAGPEANPTVLGGLLHSLLRTNQRLVQAAVAQVFDNPRIARFAPYIVSITRPTSADLDRILLLLEASLVKPDSIRRLGYGGVLGAIDPDTVCKFLMRLAAFGPRGVQTALFLGFMYTSGEPSARWSACTPFFRTIASQQGIFEEGDVSFDRYALEESINRLLRGDGDETELANVLTLEILRVCTKHDIDFEALEIMRPIYFTLLETYPTVVWPLTRQALETSGPLGEWHVLTLFKRSMVMRDSPESAFELVPDADLKQWFVEKPEIAPRLVGRSITLFKFDGTSLAIEPLAEYIVDEFGQDERVLGALSANLGSFAWSGSAVPAYEQRLMFALHFSNHKTPTVKRWACELVSSFESTIRNQRKRDEEHEQGIWSPPFLGETPDESE